MSELLTDLEVTNYIGSINAKPGTPHYNMYHRLLTYDIHIFKTIMYKLIKGTLTIDKLIEKQNLLGHNFDSYLRELANTANIDDADYQAYKNAQAILTTYGIRDLKVALVKNLGLNIYNNTSNVSNYTIRINTSGINTGYSGKAYDTFHDAELAFYKYSFPRGDNGLPRTDQPLVNSELNAKYQALVLASKVFGDKVALIMKLVERFVAYPLILDNINNLDKLKDYPTLSYILNRGYLNIDNNDYEEVIKRYINQYIQDIKSADTNVTDLHTSGMYTISNMHSMISYAILNPTRSNGSLNLSYNMKLDYTSFRMLKYYLAKFISFNAKEHYAVTSTLPDLDAIKQDLQDYEEFLIKVREFLVEFIEKVDRNL